MTDPKQDAAESDATLYLDRFAVRKILIGQPDDHLHIIEGALADVDGLPIFTKADLAIDTAPKEKPVMWQYLCRDGTWVPSDPPSAVETRDEPERFRALYTSAPPAPGWDEAISAAVAVMREYPNQYLPCHMVTTEIEALRREAPDFSGIVAAAEYLVRTVERKAWDGVRKDGRARDGGFAPFHSAQFSYGVNSSARQDDYRDVVREIVRLSRPDAGGGVRVKPLEWHQNGSADSIFGKYTLTSWASGSFTVSRPGRHPDGNSYSTVDEAKAAAQADYERRILPALSKPSDAGNASAELEDARSEAADSLRTLDAIAEYISCPQDEELTVDHVRQHYMKLENAAQRQGIEDAGRIANAQAYASAEAEFPAWGAEDEAYKLGRHDGYESAIQDLDIATGGDGEFNGSTIPGETVDIPAMKQRVISRFATNASTEARLREALNDLLERCDHQPVYADGRKGPYGLNRSGWREREALAKAREALSAGGDGQTVHAINGPFASVLPAGGDGQLRDPENAPSSFEVLHDHYGTTPAAGDEAKKSEGGHESRVAAVSCESRSTKVRETAILLVAPSVSTSPHREDAAGVAPGPSDPTADRREIMAGIVLHFLNIEVQHTEYGLRYSTEAFDKMVGELAALDGGR